MRIELFKFYPHYGVIFNPITGFLSHSTQEKKLQNRVEEWGREANKGIIAGQ
jgi:hypothetical protein